MHSSSLGVTLIGSLLVGAALHLLRQAIDRDRGILAEVLAISLPLLLACGFVLLAGDPVAGPREFALRLAPMVELIFLSLPIFIFCRMVERLTIGGQLNIVDLFRLTTAIAVALVVLTSLHNPLALADVGLAAAVYLSAEYATHTRNPDRYLATVFSLGFIACSSLAIVLERPLFTYAELLATTRPTGPLGLILYSAVLTTAPRWMHWTMRHAAPLRQFAVTLASWRLTSVRPSVAISTQPMLNLWNFSGDVCYLNHGSFGAVPVLLRHRQQRIRAECEDEPVDFLVRKLEKQWYDARLQLAVWLGTQAENIAFCENATAAMNEIAHWFPLAEGDEVLINNHEYGAVKRIWQRKCRRSGATLVTAQLPWPLVDPQQIVDAILQSTSQHTKLVVLSHVTSPTAIIFPIAHLCAVLNDRGIPTCVDGPHGLLQQPLKLHSLACDFYTASCHKWLCAPLGSGFVYASERWHEQFVSSRLSWGRLQPAQPNNWSEELLWTGTRDYSAYLTIPHAIRFFQRFDATSLDERNHALACYAREHLLQLPGVQPVTPAGRQWFGWMVAVQLPDGDHATLQDRLWHSYRIEVPIVHFGDRWLVRVSCHLYNSTADITRLINALRKELSD